MTGIPHECELEMIQHTIYTFRCTELYVCYITCLPSKARNMNPPFADLYCFTNCTQAAQEILFQSKQQKDTQVRIISPMTPEIDFFKQYLLTLAFLFFFWSYRCRKLDCIRMGSVSKGSIPFLLS